MSSSELPLGICWDRWLGPIPPGICWVHLTKTPGLQAKNQTRWQQITRCVQRLVVNATVRHALRRIIHLPRGEFKDLSRDGAVYLGRGRYRDAGNWKYAVLYHLWNKWSIGTELEPIIRELIFALPKSRLKNKNATLSRTMFDARLKTGNLHRRLRNSVSGADKLQSRPNSENPR